MIAFPSMLVQAAVLANISIPPYLDKYEMSEFPHWHTFCVMQLCRPTRYAGEHWDNAKIIASIPADKVLKTSLGELMELGFSC